MHIKFLKNKRGFTLIEVIVSFALLAIVTTAFVGVFIGSAKLNKVTMDTDRANSEVVNYINEVKSKDGSLIIVEEQDADLQVDFNGETIYIEGKVVLVYDSGGKLVEYKLFMKE